MQMAMLAYSTLDVFVEKSQIMPDRVKTALDAKDRQQGREPSKEVEPTYLGLLTQSFVDRYELDVYGYVSISNYKYVVFKVEQRLNPVNISTQERQIRIIFENVQTFHTGMMQNPFFNFDSHGSYYTGGAGNAGRTSITRASTGEEDDHSDYSSSSSRSSNSSSNDQTQASQATAKSAPLNSKKMNNDCLKALTSRLDSFVAQCDANLRQKV